MPDIIQLTEGHYLGDENQHCVSSPAGSMLQGVAVSGGKVRAKARVIAELKDQGQFQRGEILVARQTDPGWAPLFFLASGLVMERGGMLSHGASVAREFGIPAVSAGPEVTVQITTGETLLVDGDEGLIVREEGV